MEALDLLAHYVAGARMETVPDAVRDEAVRALVDWFGCALAGSTQDIVERGVDRHVADDDSPRARLLGRGERSDGRTAAFGNGVAASVLEFDGIDPRTGLRAVAPIAAAALALAEADTHSGAALLHAVIVGVEVACRAAQACAAQAGGEHERDRICGALGAAAASARLLEFDAPRTRAALVAALCASGTPDGASIRQHPHVGLAARDGLSAALSARTAAAHSEHESAIASAFLRGFDHPDPINTLASDRDSTWALTRLAYRPYPCSPVLHAVIDACIQLRREHRLRARDFDRVTLRLNPSVLERTNHVAPGSAPQARRSVQHVTAVALMDGAAGIRQFEVERIRSARVEGLRARVTALADERLSEHAARVAVVLRDGRILEHGVRYAWGSPLRPLTDAELSDKFRDLATEVLATAQAERLLALLWNLPALGDAGAIARASVPEDDALSLLELPGSPLIPR